MAGLIEAGPADEELEVAEVAAGEDECVLAVNVAGNVDRAALGWRFLNVAVGTDEAAGGEKTPWPMMSRCQQAVVVGAFAAHCGTELDPVGRRAYGNHVDHAADGARSVEVADAAANKLDVADGELGLLLPVNPSAERIVERHIVLGDEGAAGGGGTESAKADALRSGIGDERAGTAEKLDAGKLAQLVIEGEAGGGAQRLLSKQARSDRALQNAKRSAIRGDGDLVDSSLSAQAWRSGAGWDAVGACVGV